MNPTIGSRMQQACDSMAEKPGEVVQNHKVGTRARGGNFETEAKVATPSREWTPGTMSMDGWIYESHERWSMNSTGTQ